jgi:hypothetical protein
MARTSRTTREPRAVCSKNPSSKAAASEEARRTLRYVELLSEARTPLADFFSILLLDLPIAGDLRGRCHWRGDLDLWPLHGRELIRSLACGNPRIVRLY